jgi:SCY1-like protein 2
LLNTNHLQELSGSNGLKAKANDDFMSFGADSAFGTNGGSDDPEIDFERLVKGTSGTTGSSNTLQGWDATPSKPQSIIVELSKTDLTRRSSSVTPKCFKPC